MFGERGASMDIGKFQDSFDENRKLRCFNYNIYGYIAKKYRKQKKGKEIRKCYKYNKVGHIAKDCKSKQSMKIRRNQEETDELAREDDKEEDFVEGLEQARYNEPLYIVNPKIDMLFQTDKITK